MDNHIFRGAPLGFNRQDVMDYIGKTKKDAETAAAALSGQLEAAQREIGELRRQLERGGARADELEGALETARRQYERERAGREALAQESAGQAETVQSLTEERDRLAARLGELSGQSESLRREKEKLAQLELDAHRRADAVLAQAQEEAALRVSEAQSRAEGLLDAANAQAAAAIAQGQARREELLRDAEERIVRSAAQCGELFDACERIAAHIASELKLLDAASGRLPAGFDCLRSGLEELRERVGAR